MDNFYDVLKKHIANCRPNFGDGVSVLTMLYEAYSDYNRLDDEKVTKGFEELYRQMNGMELREMDTGACKLPKVLKPEQIILCQDGGIEFCLTDRVDNGVKSTLLMGLSAEQAKRILHPWAWLGLSETSG